LIALLKARPFLGKPPWQLGRDTWQLAKARSCDNVAMAVREVLAFDKRRSRGCSPENGQPLRCRLRLEYFGPPTWSGQSEKKPVKSSFSQMNASNPGNPMSYWCCLFAVEIKGGLRLAYGYAVSVRNPEANWGRGMVLDSAAWKLQKFTAFLSEDGLLALRTEIASGAVRVKVDRNGKAEEFVIVCSNLTPRPSVYASPRSDIARDSIQSFSDDLAIVDALWDVSKSKLIEELLPQSKLGGSNVESAISKMMKALREETGIAFDGIGFSRIGNFEIVRHLSGDCRLDDGLSVVFSGLDDVAKAKPTSLVVWLEPPLAERSALWVNCRMFNSGNPLSPTCILDELRQWCPGEFMHFLPSEPFSLYEITVWSEGRRVAYQRFIRLREINVTMHVAGPRRTHITKWSEKYGGDNRQRAQAVSFDSVSRTAIGSTAEDLWRQAEQESIELAAQWFPEKPEGRYFPNKDIANLDAVDFLIKLMQRPEVRGIVVADPYFDREGVESLLARCGNVRNLRVIASHEQPGQDLLKEICKACAQMFPPKLRVLNVETEAGGDRQFHDRYVVFELESQISEVWMLSNSLSSFAKRYPLVIAPLAASLAKEVAAYVSELESGNLKGRSKLKAVQVWPISLGSPNEGEGGRAAANLPELDRIPDLLVSMGVSSNDLAAAIKSVKSSLSTPGVAAGDLLQAVAQWAYRGGPQAAEYCFSAEILATIARVLTEFLQGQFQTSNETRHLDELNNATPTPESLQAVWAMMRYSSPMDLRVGLKPEVHFFAEALWDAQPSTLVDVLESSRSFEVLGWIASDADSREETRAKLLLGSKLGVVQALGIRLLRDLFKCGGAVSAQEANFKMGAILQSFPIDPWERFLSLVFISVISIRWGIPASHSNFELSNHWPTRELEVVDVDRLVKLVSKAAPYRAIACIAQLAEDCPYGESAVVLKKWCLDRLLSEFPMKKRAPVSTGVLFNPDDGETKFRAAGCAWNLHGDKTPRWYIEDVLSKLNLWEALEPLLRIKAFSNWNDALERLTMALQFGVELHAAAPAEQCSDGFRKKVAPAMAKLLSKLGPEIWHHFPDFHHRLAVATAFLASSYDASDPEHSAISDLVGEAMIPGLWKLWMSLQSAELVRLLGGDLVRLAEDPSSPAGFRGREPLQSCVRRCISSAGKLVELHPDLEKIVQGVQAGLNAWQARFEIA
jgi:hypothetical protein